MGGRTFGSTLAGASGKKANLGKAVRELAAIDRSDKVITPNGHTDEGSGVFTRPAFANVRLSWAMILWVAIIALGALLRFWDLGYRMLHHDESIHAVYSWYLLTGRGYVHNPTYHGPFLYHAEALMYLLFGAADYTARMAPAIFGTLMVGMPYLLRRQLGERGALVSAFLLAISPSILYYSRSLRHDIFAATATLALVIALWRYVSDRQPRWLYLAAGGLLLGFSTHELTFMTVFILVLFIAPFALLSLRIALVRRDPRTLSPWAEFLLLIGTLSAPLFASVVLLVPGVGGPKNAWPAPGEPNGVLLVTFVALVVAAATLGLWWHRTVWGRAAMLFWVPLAFLYTAFFSNPQGLFSGAIGSLLYWLTQQEVQRGGQPWFYYLLLLPLYEFLPLLAGLAAILYAIRRRHLFGLFLAYWALLSLILYSWAGEKMPWLVIHIAVPFVLLAGLGIGKAVERVDWREVWVRGGGCLALWYLLALVVLVSLWNLGVPNSAGRTPIQSQQVFFQGLALLAVFAALVFLAVRHALVVGPGAVLLLPAVVVVAGLLPLTIRASIVANFHNGDTPTEMLVYTQSSPDVGKVMREIERVGFRTGAGMDLKVAYDSDVSWPFEWYLRDYKNRAFYGGGTPPTDAPVVLVGLDGNHDAQVRPVLGPNYVGQRYRLRWWFPEDYRAIGENVPPLAFEPPIFREHYRQAVSFLNSVKWLVTDPPTRARMWRYFLNRETLNPLGSTDFMLYERRDLVAGTFGVTATTGAAVPEDDQYAKKTIEATAKALWGSAGTGDGQLNQPKNLAVAPDGTIYVLDSRNHRVQLFDQGGRFLSQFGSGGQGEGQLNEPWGIAIATDGTVYIADTWNHRIQKFDKSGAFLAQWGQHAIVADGTGAPGSFFGPRGVALDPAGNLYVTDTGNHRIQKFDRDGKLLAVYGRRGGADGYFNEPVGIAIDRSGMIYIADTWNRRVVKLNPDFTPIAQWPVAGWQSELPSNKPYLALDGSGNVFVTDPENNRIVKFSATGGVLAVWGKFGSDAASLRMPTGIVFDKTGEGALLVADSQNNRVAKFEPVP